MTDGIARPSSKRDGSSHRSARNSSSRGAPGHWLAGSDFGTDRGRFNSLICDAAIPRVLSCRKYRSHNSYRSRRAAIVLVCWPNHPRRGSSSDTRRGNPLPCRFPTRPLSPRSRNRDSRRAHQHALPGRECLRSSANPQGGHRRRLATRPRVEEISCSSSPGPRHRHLVAVAQSALPPPPFSNPCHKHRGLQQTPVQLRHGKTEEFLERLSPVAGDHCSHAGVPAGP